MRLCTVMNLTLSVIVMYSNITTAKEIDDRTFQLSDIFELEYAADPQIAPDGRPIFNVPNYMEIISDNRRS